MNTTATQLAAQLETRNGSASGFGLGPVCDAAAAELRRLDAEVEALRKDAERYRWLVSRPLDGDDEFYISAQDSKTANADGWWALGGDMDKSQADAYIDAAMKGAAHG